MADLSESPEVNSHGCADSSIPQAFFTATRDFAIYFNSRSHDAIKGNVHVKRLATYVEELFKDFLVERKVIEETERGNAAKGLDLPSLNTDIKLTQYSDPQTSSPFSEAKQKIEGLGYHLLLFTYEKREVEGKFFLPFKAVRFIPKERTGDYTTTKEIRDIINRPGNAEDVSVYLREHFILTDEQELLAYSEHLFRNIPNQGYLSAYEAAQWRLTYRKVINDIPPDIVVLDPISVPNRQTNLAFGQ